MNDQLRNKVKVLLKIANLKPEENNFFLSKLDSSTLEQLEKLHDDLIQQIAVNIYLESEKELQENDQLLDENDEKEYIEKLNMKLANINHQLQSDTEIDKIRSELVNLAG